MTMTSEELAACREAYAAFAKHCLGSGIEPPTYPAYLAGWIDSLTYARKETIDKSMLKRLVTQVFGEGYQIVSPEYGKEQAEQIEALRNALVSAVETIEWMHGCTSPASDEVERAIQDGRTALKEAGK